MYNKKFSTTDLLRKKEKISKILRSRCEYITEYHISAILDALDFNCQYYIKVVYSAQKFINIITDEFILANEVLTVSVSYNIYGIYVPGYYKAIQGIKEQQKGSFVLHGPAAAIKKKTVTTAGKESVVYSLIVYDCD